jgi:hypothetical protein
VTRPLTDEEVAALDVSRRPSLPAATQAELEVPPPESRRALGQVRERLDKVLTESVPLDGHGNGYGGHGNGHGDGQAEAEHAAIPSGETAGSGSSSGPGSGDGSGSGDGQEDGPA